MVAYVCLRKYWVDNSKTKRALDIPSRKSFADLLSLGGPVAGVVSLKVSCYSLITIAATVMGKAVGAAAHQVVFGVFIFFAVFGDAISTVAQVSWRMQIHTYVLLSIERRRTR